jgi:galactokinase/mevalonate kinase-like predicted kinase
MADTDSDTANSTVASAPSIIIAKYLRDNTEIAADLQRVLLVIFKGEKHTATDWATIIATRLAKPAV